MSKKQGVTEAAKVLGHLGGLIGGPARARKLSHMERVNIARKGGRAKGKRKK